MKERVWEGEWLRWPYGLMSQLSPRRSISTRLYICTRSDVQFCARDRASACGKSKQRQPVVLIKLVYWFAM